jgi:hypothetical protein
VAAAMFDHALFSADLIQLLVMLMAALVGGGAAVWLIYRWYRNSKAMPLTSREALSQLAQALEENQEEFDPAEVKCIHDAIERQLEDGGSGPGQIAS